MKCKKKIDKPFGYTNCPFDAPSSRGKEEYSLWHYVNIKTAFFSKLLKNANFFKHFAKKSNLDFIFCIF